MGEITTSVRMPSVPDYALRVLSVLEAAGFEAWVVGGWVRDALRGMDGHDVDITTSARWEEGERVLRAAGLQVERTGIAHGTVTAMSEGRPVEVTTYRVEGAYSDHRHPDEVRFVDDVRADLARRDLTINAMAYHPQRGLLDPYHGREDMAHRLIRTVGEPERRFEEDALRMLRAVRFGLRLGYAIEPATQRALVERASELAYVAPERIGVELDAIVSAGHAGRALIEQPDLMCAAIPELGEARGFDQRSVYHVYDVYEHIAHVCHATEAFTAGVATRELRWAALLHDVAKPRTFSLDVAGRGHFFDHPRQGARMAETIMGRMGMPQDQIRLTSALIELHDERMPLTSPAILGLLRRLNERCPGFETSLAFQLFDLRRADAVSKRPSAAVWAHKLDGYTSLLRAELNARTPYTVRQLAIGGQDIMHALDIPRGPGIGMQLEFCLHAVMEGEVRNERESLLSWLGGKAL